MNRERFHSVMRLVSIAQSGAKLSPSIIAEMQNVALPTPQFAGVQLPAGVAAGQDLASNAEGDGNRMMDSSSQDQQQLQQSQPQPVAQPEEQKQQPQQQPVVNETATQEVRQQPIPQQSQAPQQHQQAPLQQIQQPQMQQQQQQPHQVPQVNQFALFDALFTHADTSGSGKIGGREAVAFLSTSGLPKLMLREVRRCNVVSSHRFFA